MTLLNAVAAGMVLALLILAFVTRSVLATIAGAMLIVAAAVLATGIAIGNDVADVVAYLEEPEKPLLVALARDDVPIAATEIHVDKLQAIRGLMKGLNSDDPVSRAQAEIDFRTYFSELIPVQHQGERLTPEVLHKVIDVGAHGLTAKELERLAARVKAAGWEASTEQHYRTVVLRMDYAIELIGDEKTALLSIDLHGDTVEAEVDLAYLVECISAPDCGARLGRVGEKPSLLVHRLGTLENLDEVLENYPELEQAVQLHADYIPRNSLANVLAAGLVYMAAIDLQPPAERASAVVAAMRQGGIDLYPRTAIPTLVDTAFHLVPDAIVKRIGAAIASTPD